MKKILVIVVLLFLTYLVLSSGNGSPGPSIPQAEAEVLRAWENPGDRVNYVILSDGGVYEPKGDQYKYVDQYYDPSFDEENHVYQNGNVFLKGDENGSILFQKRNNFTDSFENGSTMPEITLSDKNLEGNGVIQNGVTTYDINKLGSRWNTVTLQSPKTPEISDYNALWHQIERGEADFVENRVEPSSEQAHRGNQSIRMYSAAPSRGMVVSKASFATQFVHFEKGDDFWFKGYYYFEEGLPLTILDLESTWLLGSSGMRILLRETGEPYLELKAFDKPIWESSTDYRIPQNKWVEVKAHFKLDETNGLAELWIDGQKVVEGRGQTLPLADTIYDSLELGISATLEDTVLYIDNIQVSESPL